MEQEAPGVKEPIEYNLRGIAHTTTAGDDRLINYMRDRPGPELLTIPYVGEVAKTYFVRSGITDAFVLYGWILRRNGNLQSCLDGFKEIFHNSQVKYRKILLVVLFMMSLKFDIEEPPDNWEHLIYLWSLPEWLRPAFMLVREFIQMI